MSLEIDINEHPPELRLGQLGYLNFGERRYGQHIVLESMRAEWEYQIVLSGGCYPTLGGRPIERPRSPVLWIFTPESIHGWQAAPGDVSEVRVLHFREAPHILRQALAGASHGYAQLGEAELGALLTEFDTVRAIQQTRTATAPAIFARANLSFALAYAAIHPPQAAAPVDALAGRKVKQAVNWMRQNLTQAPEITGAAKAAGVSATHLRRLFREVLGKAPHQVLLEMRMSAARQLILNGQHSLAQISDLLAFSEPSAFSRCYRQHFGESPSKLRPKAPAAHLAPPERKGDAGSPS